MNRKGSLITKEGVLLEECNKGHKITIDDIYLNSNGSVTCRFCRKAYMQKYHQEHRSAEAQKIRKQKEQRRFQLVQSMIEKIKSREQI